MTIAPIIDSHTHVWHSAPSYPDPGATIVSPLDEVSPDLLTDYMDDEGVSRAVLVQPQCSAEDNALVSEQAHAHPSRFVAVCVVDPHKEGAGRQLLRWTERGCRGVRLRPRVEAAVLEEICETEMWAQVVASGLVVNILCGVENLKDIYSIAERAPAVPLLLDHLGYPDVGEGTLGPTFKALLRLSGLPNVFVKLSGYYHFSHEPYPYHDCWDLVRAAYDTFGAQRLLWGSDFPHCLLRGGYGRQVRLAEQYFDFISPEDLLAIMSRNAQRLYWRGSG